MNQLQVSPFYTTLKGLVENAININIPLGNLDDTECAIADFNFIAQNAAWNSSSNITIKAIQKTNQDTRL